MSLLSDRRARRSPELRTASSRSRPRTPPSCSAATRRRARSRPAPTPTSSSGTPTRRHTGSADTIHSAIDYTCYEGIHDARHARRTCSAAASSSIEDGELTDAATPGRGKFVKRRTFEYVARQYNGPTTVRQPATLTRLHTTEDHTHGERRTGMTDRQGSTHPGPREHGQAGGDRQARRHDPRRGERRARRSSACRRSSTARTSAPTRATPSGSARPRTPRPARPSTLMQELAKELGIVLVLPIYEEAMQGVYYNTTVVIDADGTNLGKYRKTHIPQVGPIFWEKYFFKPGNLGYPVFDTAVGKVGVVICYDRHFPEICARARPQGRADRVQPARDGREPVALPVGARADRAAPRRTATGSARSTASASRARSASTSSTGRATSPIRKGQIVAQANDTDDAIVIADIDLDEIQRGARHVAVLPRSSPGDLRGDGRHAPAVGTAWR